MAIFDISAPPIEPVSLDYAKVFLRVDNDDEDALITDLIRAARERVETLINAALISRPKRMIHSRLSEKGVFLNYGEVTQVTALRLTNGETESDIPLTALSVNLRCQPPVIRLKERASFASFDNRADTLEIDFTAGYGDSADDVPMPLRQAVLLLLAQSYEYRGQDSAPPTVPPTVPMMVDALLMPYRGVRL